MSDREVISEKDFNRFYLKFSKAIIRYIYRIVRDADKSEDLAQETFIRFFNNVDDYDTESSRTKNYLYTIAKNISIDFLKKIQLEENKYRAVHFEEIHLSKSFYNELDSSAIDGKVISTIHDTIENFSGRKKSIAVDRIFHNKKLTLLSRKFNTTTYQIKKIEEEAYNDIKAGILQLYPDFEFDPDAD
jgi:RNA polymerase sigma-70 factor (ECF subfamily)